MKKLVCIMLSILLVASLCACSTSSDEDTLKIGIIQLTEHQALDSARDGFVDKLNEAGIKVEIDVQNAQGEQTVCATIASTMVNDGVDLILAIATPAAQAAAQATSDIPILVTAVTDPASSGLVNSNENPGTNVSGTSDMNPIEAQVDLLLKFVPDAKTVGILYCSSEDNSILQANIAEEALKARNVNVVVFTASDSSEVQSVTQSMVGKVDAVYIPTDNLMADSMSAIGMILTPAGIPVIAGEANMVMAGGLATYGIDYYALGQKTAEMAIDILVNGADVSTMPIAYYDEESLSLTINEETLNQLGLKVPADLQ